MPEVGGGAGPVVLRTGELSLTPISCNTVETGPAPHQGRTIEPTLSTQDEPAPKLWAWENCPHYLSVMW